MKAIDDITKGEQKIYIDFLLAFFLHINL